LVALFFVHHPLHLSAYEEERGKMGKEGPREYTVFTRIIRRWGRTAENFSNLLLTLHHLPMHSPGPWKEKE